jgi:hypothetical protein
VVNYVRTKYALRKALRNHKPPIPETPKMNMFPVWGKAAQANSRRYCGHSDAASCAAKLFPPTLQQRIVEEANKAVAQRWTGASIQKWYGMQGPWCCMTWSRIKDLAGSKSPKYAYVPSVVTAAAKGEHGLHIVSSPRPGDAVIYDWQGDHYADHIGTLLRKVGGLIYVAEGNAGANTVTKQVRTTANVLCYVRVGS